jgi:hypothetical protein
LPAEPAKLDQPSDLGLGAPHEHPALGLTQALSEHRKVEHERRVRERELGQIDDEVSARGQRARKITTPKPLRGEVLVACAAQHPQAFLEGDDVQKLAKLPR